MNKNVYKIIILLIFFTITAVAPGALADTLNIQRIHYSDQYEAAVEIAKLVYPFGADGRYPYRAGTVILVNGDNHLDALIGSSLIHHPRNGPILYTKQGTLPAITRTELLRLSPSGVGSESQVLLVGGINSISAEIESNIQNLGFTTSRIGGDNVIETAAEVDKFLVFQGYIYHLILKRDIILFPEELFAETAIPASWIAHWDASVLITKKNGLPEATKRAIEEREIPPDVFIIGGENVVSPAVEKELRALPVDAVERISGRTPSEIAVNFAKFQKDDFGWGLTERGSKAFVLVRAQEKTDYMSAIAASILGHLGKHAPILLTDGATIDQATRDYLKSVQPFIPFTPANISENHGYILGNEEVISREVESDFNDLIVGDNNLAVVLADIDRTEVRPGEPVTVTIHVHNFGPDRDTFTIPLTVNGEVEQTETVTIDGIPEDLILPDDTNVVFMITKNEPGTYMVEAGGFETSFRVTSSGGTLSLSSLWWFVVIVILVMASGVGFFFGRKKKKTI